MSLISRSREFSLQQYKKTFLTILTWLFFLLHLSALGLMLQPPRPSLGNFAIVGGFTISLFLSIILNAKSAYRIAATLFCVILNADLLVGLGLNLPVGNVTSTVMFVVGIAQAVVITGILLGTKAIILSSISNLIAIILLNFNLANPANDFWTNIVLFGGFLFVSTAVFALYQQSLERTLADNTALLNQVQEQAAVLATQNEQLRQLNAKQEQFLVTLEENVVERTAELNAFVSTVAHDLKTPLGGIIGYGEMVLEDLSELPEAAESTVIVGGMVRSAFRMRDIIESLLMLARTRTTEVAVAPLDMAHVVAHVQDRLDYLITHKHVQLVVPDQWPTAMGQAAWVEEVWANYISNAIKYGGHPPVIQLGADIEPDGRVVRFWVQDNGKGLSPTNQDRLFLPFVQLHQVKDSHGLGLSIVQRIVTKLGGRVGVESEIGRGSRFYFTLPAAIDERVPA